MPAVFLAKDDVEDADVTHALLMGEMKYVRLLLNGMKDWELRTQPLVKGATGRTVGIALKDYVYGTVIGRTK